MVAPTKSHYPLSMKNQALALIKFASNIVGRTTLTFIFLSMSALPLANAAVSAQLSEQLIDELETVRLTVRASNTRKTESLDTTPLEADFHIMGTNTSSQYRFINGREQSWVDYQITLQPKRTGNLTIPSLSVGHDQTPTLTLTVQPLTAETRKAIDELVFFEQDISSQSVYVQAELVVTRRLLYSGGVQLYSDLPGAPEIEDAVVHSLGEPTSGTTQRNGKTYGVVEQKYAIFPEVSGTFTIPPITITASVRLNSNGRVSRKGVRVGTKITDVQVLPVPANYPKSQAWLPAKNVVLHQVLTPDNQDHTVGDTITHELLIHISGNMGSTASPLPLSLDEDKFRTYPQAPVLDDSPQAGTMVGSRLQTTSLLPLVPGALDIPATELVWFDTVKEEVRYAQVPPVTLLVIGEPMLEQMLEQTPSDTDNLDSTSGNSGEAEQLPGNLSREKTPWLSPTSIALLTLVLVIALALFWRYLVAPIAARRAEKSTQVEKTPAPSLNEIEALIKDESGKHISQAIREFIAAHYNTDVASAMVSFRTHGDHAKEMSDHLNRMSYADHDAPQSREWVKEHAIPLLTTLGKTRSSKVPKPSPLPPLYAHKTG